MHTHAFQNIQPGHYLQLSAARFVVQSAVNANTPPHCVELTLVDKANYNKPYTASTLTRAVKADLMGIYFCNRHDLPQGLLFNEMPIHYSMLRPGIYVVDDYPRAIYFLATRYPKSVNSVRLFSWLRDPEYAYGPIKSQDMRIISTTNKKVRSDFDKWMNELVRKHKLLQEIKTPPNVTLTREDYSALVAKLYFTGAAPHVAATELLEVTNRLWLRDYIEVGQKVWITDSITWEN
jgi:hypothetical protein